MTAVTEGARILVVDDDARIAASIRRALVYEGYRVAVASDGPAALVEARETAPDLVVLDAMLPGLDGVDVCRRLRAGGDVAILMVTARDATRDLVTGLDAGADDYLTKPFAYEELLARVRALLRRRSPVQPACGRIGFGGIEADLETREVWRDGRPIALTALEFDLLVHLLKHPRAVHTREGLLGAVWTKGDEITNNAVDVYVGYLRQKLEAGGEPRLIQTVRGVGYALREA